MSRPKPVNPFDAFLSKCVSDCVNARSMSADEYLSLNAEEKAEDARLLGARAMERREVITRGEAAAYGLGIHEEPRE